MQILEVTELGLRSAALRLKHRTVPLRFLVIPMTHMANAGFYRDVTRLLRDVDVVVAEGIRGRSAVGSAMTATYRVLQMRRRTELVPQTIPYEKLGKTLVTPDLTAGEFRAEWRKTPWWTRALLVPGLFVFTAIRLVTPRKSLLRQVVGEELNDLPSDLDEALADHPLMKVTGGARDERLCAALEALHTERGQDDITVAVIYGAGHVPVIVDCLRGLGYFVRTAEWLTVISL